MVAFGGTLSAYKFFNIQVTDKFRKVITIAIFSFVGVMLLNFVLASPASSSTADCAASTRSAWSSRPSPSCSPCSC